MQIESTKLEKGVFVRLSGRMDADNALPFQSACEHWIGNGERHIPADLSDLQYISSMGLSSFMAVAKTLQPKAGALIPCNLRGLPWQVLEITRLLDVFPVFETTEAAIAGVS